MTFLVGQVKKSDICEMLKARKFTDREFILKISLTGRSDLGGMGRGEWGVGRGRGGVGRGSGGGGRGRGRIWGGEGRGRGRREGEGHGVENIQLHFEKKTKWNCWPRNCRGRSKIVDIVFEFWDMTFRRKDGLKYIKYVCKNVGEEVVQKRIAHNCEYCKRTFGRSAHYKRGVQKCQGSGFTKKNHSWLCIPHDCEYCKKRFGSSKAFSDPHKIGV